MWRTWLARFGFSFIALAVLMGYNAYQFNAVEGKTPRVVGYTVAAALLAAAGLAGLRERHRPPSDPDGGR
ncbi:MAG TPA: hypothetical protein VF796_25635 [Humisphaera sp.]